MYQPSIEELHELFDCDYSKGKLYWRGKRGNNRAVIGEEAGTIDAYGYIGIKVNGKTIKAHRAIWAFYHGKWPDGEIDHINRMVSDNRIVNLREATRSQNMGNSSVQRRSKSGVKGVTLHTTTGKWVANIRINYELKYLGIYDSIDEAAEAYKIAAKQYFGEFA